MESTNVAGHDIIVMGASAGGVEALVTIVRQLPPDLPAAVFVVLHIPANGGSQLAAILNRASPLTAVNPEDGETIRHGHIYVAPPDMHLLVEHGRVRVVHGPKENRHRPAVDPLFRTAAVAYGPRVVGVVLTGSLDDGTAGLHAIKRRGGVAIVQDPDEALYPGMPLSALTNVDVDYRLSLTEIPHLLTRLAGEPAPDEGGYPVPDDLNYEARMSMLDLEALNAGVQGGVPSAFSCPECGGVLHEMTEDHLVRFRCRVGHAYSPDSVLAEQDETLEEALWSALKTLEESMQLSQRLAEGARRNGHTHAAARFEQKIQENKVRVDLLRRVLLGSVVKPEEDANHRPEPTGAQPAAD